MGIGPRRTGVTISNIVPQDANSVARKTCPYVMYTYELGMGKSPYRSHAKLAFLTVCDSWMHPVGSKSKVIEKARNHLSDQDTYPPTPEVATCQCSTPTQHRPRTAFALIMHRNYQVMTIRELFPIKKLAAVGGGA